MQKLGWGRHAHYTIQTYIYKQNSGNTHLEYAILLWSTIEIRPIVGRGVVEKINFEGTMGCVTHLQSVSHR